MKAFVTAAIAAALLLVPTTSPTQQLELKRSSAVVCDTVEQSARLHELGKTGASNPADAVNAEVDDKTACIASTFYYFDGGEARDLGDAVVRRVLILAVRGAYGAIQFVAHPKTYFVVDKKPGANL